MNGGGLRGSPPHLSAELPLVGELEPLRLPERQRLVADLLGGDFDVISRFAVSA